jgi:hypothetical protein
LDFGLSFCLSLKPVRFYLRAMRGELKVVKTTRYFEEQVLRKRTYIKREWCERALREPVRREVQPDGRIRYWTWDT